MATLNSENHQGICFVVLRGRKVCHYSRAAGPPKIWRWEPEKREDFRTLKTPGGVGINRINLSPFLSSRLLWNCCKRAINVGWMAPLLPAGHVLVNLSVPIPWVSDGSLDFTNLRNAQTCETPGEALQKGEAFLLRITVVLTEDFVRAYREWTGNCKQFSIWWPSFLQDGCKVKPYTNYIIPWIKLKLLKNRRLSRWLPKRKRKLTDT